MPGQHTSPNFKKLSASDVATIRKVYAEYQRNPNLARKNLNKAIVEYDQSISTRSIAPGDRAALDVLEIGQIALNHTLGDIPGAGKIKTIAALSKFGGQKLLEDYMAGNQLKAQDATSRNAILSATLSQRLWDAGTKDAFVRDIVNPLLEFKYNAQVGDSAQTLLQKNADVAEKRSLKLAQMRQDATTFEMRKQLDALIAVNNLDKNAIAVRLKMAKGEPVGKLSKEEIQKMFSTMADSGAGAFNDALAEFSESAKTKTPIPASELRQLQLESWGSAASAVGGLVSLAGDPKTGAAITKIGSCVIQVIDGFQKASKLFDAGSNLLGSLLTSGNVINLALGLIGAIFGGPSTEQQILDKLYDIEKKIDTIREEMHGRFDRIEKMLDAIYQDVMKELHFQRKLHEETHRRLDKVLLEVQGVSAKADYIIELMGSYFARADKKKELETAEKCLSYSDAFLVEMDDKRFMKCLEIFFGCATSSLALPALASPLSASALLEESVEKGDEKNIASLMNLALQRGAVSRKWELESLDSGQWARCTKGYLSMATKYPDKYARLVDPVSHTARLLQTGQMAQSHSNIIRTGSTDPATKSDNREGFNKLFLDYVRALRDLKGLMEERRNEIQKKEEFKGVDPLLPPSQKISKREELPTVYLYFKESARWLHPPDDFYKVLPPELLVAERLGIGKFSQYYIDMTPNTEKGGVDVDLTGYFRISDNPRKRVVLSKAFFPFERPNVLNIPESDLIFFREDRLRAMERIWKDIGMDSKLVSTAKDALEDRGFRNEVTLLAEKKLEELRVFLLAELEKSAELNGSYQRLTDARNLLSALIRAGWGETLQKDGVLDGLLRDTYGVPSGKSVQSLYNLGRLELSQPILRVFRHEPDRKKIEVLVKDTLLPKLQVGAVHLSRDREAMARIEGGLSNLAQDSKDWGLSGPDRNVMAHAVNTWHNVAPTFSVKALAQARNELKNHIEVEGFSKTDKELLSKVGMLLDRLIERENEAAFVREGVYPWAEKALNNCRFLNLMNIDGKVQWHLENIIRESGIVSEDDLVFLKIAALYAKLEEYLTDHLHAPYSGEVTETMRALALFQEVSVEGD